MIVDEIQTQLERLSLHPVNLAATAEASGRVALHGSELSHWDVPTVVDGGWFLGGLAGLPDAAGPRATMDLFCAAHAQFAAQSG